MFGLPRLEGADGVVDGVGWKTSKHSKLGPGHDWYGASMLHKLLQERLCHLAIH